MLKLVPLLTVVGLIVALTTHFDFDAAALEAWVRAQGPLGPVLFVLTFATLQALFISSHVFIIAANAIWPAPWAILYSWLGTLGSGLLSFVFARFVARSWVQSRLPEKIKRYDEKLAESGFMTVLILRIFLFTSPPLQLGLGVSGVRFLPFLTATALGNLPSILLSTFAASTLLAWLKS